MSKLIRFFGKLEKSEPFNGCVDFFCEKNNGYISDVGDTGGKGMEKPKPSTPTTRSRRKIHNPNMYTPSGQSENRNRKKPESPTKFPNTSSLSNSDTVAESSGEPGPTSSSSSTSCTSPKKKKAHTAASTGEEAVNSDPNITPIQFNLDDTT